MSDAPEGSRPAAVRFVFHVCNDVAAMRSFYVDLLGMKEAHFMDSEEYAWLSVDCGGWQMMWFRADEEQPVPAAFAMQPGWPGGTVEATSWGVGVPEERFTDVLAALTEAGVPMFKPEPEWRQDSYWGLSVLDPMGVTVEVYSSPKEKPASTDWPGNTQGASARG